MLMTSSERSVAVTQYETALTLRRKALLQPSPQYLLAPQLEVTFSLDHREYTHLLMPKQNTSVLHL